MPIAAMQVVDGRTLITRWIGHVTDPTTSVPDDHSPVEEGSLGDATDASPRTSEIYTVDGVRLDAATLMAVNNEGSPLLPSKMGVRELRAELAARRYPLKGSKKDLQKKLAVSYLNLQS
jgi:hypothetical protein